MHYNNQLLFFSVVKVKDNRGHHDFDFGEQGWRSGESAHLPPMCPGFDSWRHMLAEFVGSLL